MRELRDAARSDASKPRWPGLRSPGDSILTTPTHDAADGPATQRAGRRAQTRDRLADEARDLHLADPDERADLGLREVLLEAQPQHLALALGQRHSRRPASRGPRQGRSPPPGYRRVADAARRPRRAAARLVERRGPIRAGGLQASSTCSTSAPTCSAISMTVGIAAQVRRQRPGAVDPQRKLLEVARHAHGPRPVAEVALDLAQDRGDRVGGERDLALDVEAVDRLDQAQRGDLHEVVQRLLAAADSGARAGGPAAGSARRSARGRADRRRVGSGRTAPGRRVRASEGSQKGGSGTRRLRGTAPEGWGACAGGGEIGRPSVMIGGRARGDSGGGRTDDDGPADTRGRREPGHAARDRRSDRRSWVTASSPTRSTSARRRSGSSRRTRTSRMVVVHDDDEHALDLIEEISEAARGPIVALVGPHEPDFVSRAALRGVFAFARPLPRGDPGRHRGRARPPRRGAQRSPTRSTVSRRRWSAVPRSSARRASSWSVTRSTSERRSASCATARARRTAPSSISPGGQRGARAAAGRAGRRQP